ncbi:MAG: DUF2442 domain-containing protein [Treponema sp.]|nr:DUF2442 domain-containing protein [Treponema sp.]
MEWQVINVEPTNDYNLILTFKEGDKRIFDFSPLLTHEINKPLRNIKFFMKAKVHHNTVMWNKELDMCPEYLYENSVQID